MICSRCKQDKPSDLFSWKNKSEGKKQNICKTCHSQYVQSHYNANKGIYTQRAVESGKRYRDRNADYVKEVKQNASCVQCGESHPAVLDFHHIDANEKDFEISRIGSGSFESLLEELQKCIILCSNCHRKLHWNEKAQVAQSVEATVSKAVKV